MKVWRVLSSITSRFIEADSYEVSESGAVVFFCGDVGTDAFASGHWSEIKLVQGDSPELRIE